MKTLLTGLLIALLTLTFASISRAQNIHQDSSLNLQYACINPITYRLDANPCYRLYVWGVFDNGFNSGRVHWQLRDSTGVNVYPNVVVEGEQVIDGEDYELWDPASKYLFTFIARIKGVVIR